MGGRRRNLFVLLFVAAAHRALAAGHRDQGDEARPRPQGRRRAGLPGPADRAATRSPARHRPLDQHHPRADRQARRRRARGRPARHRPDLGRAPRRQNAQRAIEQVGTTAQLYFYDWEPNLIGSKEVGGTRAQPPSGVSSSSELGPQTAAIRTSRSTDAGALRGAPDAYEAALAAEQLPTRLHDCSEAPASTSSSRAEDHELIAGPETRAARPLRHARPARSGPARAARSSRSRRAPLVVSEQPVDPSGRRSRTDRRLRAGTRSRTARRSRATTSTTPSRTSTSSTSPNVTFDFTDSGREAFQDVTRRIAQRGAGAGDRAGRRRPTRRRRSRATSPSSSTTRSSPGRSSTSSRTRTGSTAAPAPQISGGFSDSQEAQDLATFLQIGALPVDLKLISQSQVSATLGQQALDQGLKAGHHRPRSSSSSS